MRLIPLTCVHCGGALETTASAELFRCQFCRQLMLLVRDDGAEPGLAATRLDAHTTWKANCLHPGDTLNWQGGELLLTAEALVFVPHAFNFGPLERAVVRLASVAGTQLVPGLVSDDVTVRTTDGEAWSYRVRKGQQLRDALETARRSG